MDIKVEPAMVTNVPTDPFIVVFPEPTGLLKIAAVVLNPPSCIVNL